MRSRVAIYATVVRRIHGHVPLAPVAGQQHNWRVATKRHDNVSYLADESYFRLSGAIRAVAGIVIFELARSGQNAHVITRNFVARASTTLVSIESLWRSNAFAECWSLHRTLVDRLFHLHVLAKEDAFQAFDDWSYVQQFEAKNAALSDPEIAPKLVSDFWKPNPTQKARYEQIKRTGARWRRPRAEDAAKSLNVPFLYKFGYDFASTHVHPMANDGEEEFKRLTGLGDPPNLEYRVVLHNSILAFSLLVNEALIASRLEWHKTIHECIEASRKALQGDFSPSEKAFPAFVARGPEGPWSNLA